MNYPGMELKSRESVKYRYWDRAPVIVRALLTGFVVNTVGVGTWVLVITFLPGPWGIIFMCLFLWAYVRYFSGSWWPQSTAMIRLSCFRPTNLSRNGWFWSLLSAVFFVLIFQSGLMVTFRFMEYPAEIFKSEYNLDSMPPVFAWIGLVMASLVAGICEETGFRGYMQVPLENRYGPGIAIVIVSVAFVIVHLHQAWALPILLQIFSASLFFGILAFRTGSLIPGIIAHTVLDVFNFSYWWSDLLGKFDKLPVIESGIDSHFIFWGIIFLVSIPVFFWSTGRARKNRIRVSEPVKY